MKRKFTALALVAVLLSGSVTLLGGTAPPSSVTVPITGALADGGRFAGSFNIQRFANQNGQLVAVGTLTGTLTSAAGLSLGSVLQTITMAVTGTQASCEILHLVLGPLDLNLLGLMVHLDQVVLDISAQPGPGNLLGNLLCAIANLLNGGGPLSQILNHLVDLLNQLLSQL